MCFLFLWCDFFFIYLFFLTHGRCYNHISCVDVAPLIMFLKEIEDGTIVMMASFDDASTK